MGNGQLGTLNEGAQIGTGPVATPDTTKDRAFYNIAASAAGGTTPPNWDRYSIWGVDASYAIQGASVIQPNRIFVIPQRFNRTGIIRTITTLMESAAPARMTWGLYANVLDGECYPGIRVAQSSEFPVDTSGSATLFTWNPGYQVAAGTLLHFCVAVTDANITPDVGTGCQYANGQFGTLGIGGAFASAADFDMISAIKVTATYGSAPNMLPATFPVVGATALYGPNQGAGLTVQMAPGYRFTKT